MKLITSSVTLAAEFKRLLSRYGRFHSAVAWAGCASAPFLRLRTAQKKITRMVVGTHFYQTHPDFIETFLSHPNVRFVKQPDGTFHPKIYLFSDGSENWEILVGSANFTASAFGANIEATILISSGDPNSALIRRNALAAIDAAWKKAGHFTTKDLATYRKVWNNQRAKLASLSGKYGERTTVTKPIHAVAVATLSWTEFIKRVRAEARSEDSMTQRLMVLQCAKSLFAHHSRFSDMTDDERRFIAGLPSALETETMDSGWFGSMQGAGVFYSAINKNDKTLSAALDEVPLSGQLTREHYDRFVRLFSQTLRGTFLAPASRLLALKRPDTFVCLDSKNRKQLCLDFAIPQSNMTYDRYWDQIICRIRDSEWWLHPRPSTKAERQVSEARAAFLDALYYKPS